ncbi:hypothetical protein RRG08_012729 [Elysia crispata]|uniref:Uncharacterized protein n=1 Tax=Elysia crispata TaxID=231223 RepID=A0AAE0YR43_9GAST|nr:hypothetical protein RRG08_012729 [Elysia crispata]
MLFRCQKQREQYGLERSKKQVIPAHKKPRCTSSLVLKDDFQLFPNDVQPVFVVVSTDKPIYAPQEQWLPLLAPHGGHPACEPDSAMRGIWHTSDDNENTGPADSDTPARNCGETR